MAFAATDTAETAAPAKEILASPAPAEPPKTVTLSALYKADIMGVVSGGHSRSGRVLDDLDIGADFDLQQGLGLSGLSGHVDVMMTSGGAPNESVGALQGVNNIEVARPGTRIYQAWLEQAAAGGAVSLRVGFSDLNSEFYVTDSSALLIAPPFGISPELSGTGRNGPSIFPSTAFAVRAKARLGEAGYLLAGLYDADARDVGDPGGPDWRWRDGGLVIAEAGLTRSGKLAVGIWRYTRKAPRLATSASARATVHGVYLLAERDVVKGADSRPTISLFLRGGVSDGQTGPFSGALQIGLRAGPVFSGRPESAFSAGYSYSRISSGFREQNGFPRSDEHKLEITYSDRLSKNVSVQPDLQWSETTEAGRALHAVTACLRITVNY